MRGPGAEGWRARFIPLIEGVVEDQGRAWAARLGIEFDVRNIAAEQWFQDYVMQFAAEVSLATENVVREVISQAMAEGWSIGTMAGHLDQVFSYWQDGPGSGFITPEEWEWLDQRRPFWRREMIARTETIRASNQGTVELWQGWAVEGKEWVTAEDERVCPWCREMDERLIGIETNFWNQGDVMEVVIPGRGDLPDRIGRLTLGYEDVSAPPLHPNCRCTLIPWKAEWESVGVSPPAGLG